MLSITYFKQTKLNLNFMVKQYNTIHKNKYIPSNKYILFPTTTHLPNKMLRRSSPNKPVDPARLASNEAFERAVVGDKVLPMCANDCCTMCHLFSTHFVAGQDGFVPLERWIHVLRLLMLLSAKSNPQMTQNMQRLHCFQMC